MAIVYQPKDFLRSIAPDKQFKRLITSKLTVNRAVLSMIANAQPVLGKSDLNTLALQVLQTYRKRYQSLQLEDEVSKVQAREEALNGNKLIVSRVKTAITHQVTQSIRVSYKKERYIWLPSTSTIPDPLHQLNYGRKFTIGKGEMPGDRYGCECGIKILVDGEELEL